MVSILDNWSLDLLEALVQQVVEYFDIFFLKLILKTLSLLHEVEVCSSKTNTQANKISQ